MMERQAEQKEEYSWEYWKSGTQDPNVGPGTQDP